MLFPLCSQPHPNHSDLGNVTTGKPQAPIQNRHSTNRADVEPKRADPGGTPPQGFPSAQQAAMQSENLDGRVLQTEVIGSVTTAERVPLGRYGGGHEKADLGSLGTEFCLQNRARLRTPVPQICMSCCLRLLIANTQEFAPWLQSCQTGIFVFTVAAH